mgnify:FL=1
MCEKSFWPLTQECLDLPSLNLIHTSILGSKETYWSRGQRSRSPGSNVPKPFWSTTQGCLDPPVSNLVNTSILVSKETVDSRVKGQGHWDQMSQNHIRSITRSSSLTYLPHTRSTHLSLVDLRNPDDVGVTGSNVKVTTVKCAKTLFNE